MKLRPFHSAGNSRRELPTAQQQHDALFAAYPASSDLADPADVDDSLLDDQDFDVSSVLAELGDEGDR